MKQSNYNTQSSTTKAPTERRKPFLICQLNSFAQEVPELKHFSQIEMTVGSRAVVGTANSSNWSDKQTSTVVGDQRFKY